MTRDAEKEGTVLVISRKFVRCTKITGLRNLDVFLCKVRQMQVGISHKENIWSG